MVGGWGLGLVPWREYMNWWVWGMFSKISKKVNWCWILHVTYEPNAAKWQWFNLPAQWLQLRRTSLNKILLCWDFVYVEDAHSHPMLSLSWPSRCDVAFGVGRQRRCGKEHGLSSVVLWFLCTQHGCGPAGCGHLWSKRATDVGIVGTRCTSKFGVLVHVSRWFPVNCWLYSKQVKHGSPPNWRVWKSVNPVCYSMCQESGVKMVSF